MAERVELHCHSKFGGDATRYSGELISILGERAMPAIAITDTSSIVAFAELEYIWNTGSYSTRPIYGAELDTLKGCVTILVKDELGKRNLYKLISEPKHSELPLDKRDGLLIGSGTEKGPIYELVTKNVPASIVKREMKLFDYIEVLPDKELTDITKRIIALADELNIPVVAVSDAHYLSKEEKQAYDVLNCWKDEPINPRDRHLYTTEEMLEAFSYLGEVKAYEIVVKNSNMLAEMCQPISVIPKERSYPVVEAANEQLRESCETALQKKYSGRDIDLAHQFLEWELAALDNTSTAGIPLMEKELLDLSGLQACDISFRGTAGSSIVCYLMGISEIDPIKYNLIPEFIYGYEGQKELDIDINVPIFMHESVLEMVNSLEDVQKTVRGGTLGTVSDKLAEAMIEKYEEENCKYISPEEHEQIKKLIIGNVVKRGMHSGDAIIIPKSCDVSVFPYAWTKDGIETTYFDYHFYNRAFLKLDILKHPTIERLHRLSWATEVNLGDIPLDDESVLDIFRLVDDQAATRLTYIPEFDNEYTRELVKKLKPQSFDELVKILSLAHGTNTWNNCGEKLFKEHGIGIDRLITCREDVFEYILALGIDRETAFLIANAVRMGRISRGRNTMWKEWKQLLIEAGAEDWFIWSCEQIMYLFPRAHSISYMYMSMRMAWFLLNYPKEYAEIWGQDF